MRTTDNPILYAYAHPEVRMILQYLHDEGRQGYVSVRQALGLGPQKFDRLVDALTGFALIRMNAADDAVPEDTTVPLALRIHPKGERFLQALKELDTVFEDREELLGSDAVRGLLAGRRAAEAIAD